MTGCRKNLQYVPAFLLLAVIVRGSWIDSLLRGQSQRDRVRDDAGGFKTTDVWTILPGKLPLGMHGPTTVRLLSTRAIGSLRLTLTGAVRNTAGIF